MLNHIFISLLFSTTPNLDNTPQQIPTEVVEDTKYAVVASTKGYLDYAVNVRVEASCYGNICSVSYAEVATSRGYERVNLSSFNGEYSFYYDGYTYYFTF